MDSDQTDLGPHCFTMRLLKILADDKADEFCCDCHFKGLPFVFN